MDEHWTRSFSIKRTLGVAAGFVLLASVAMGVGVWASAAPPMPPNAARFDQRLDDENRGVPAAVVRRRDQVLAELATKPADEWASEYYEGDGLGTNTTLYLGSQSGVAATWFGCLGLYGSNEGSVERTSDKTLEFHFSAPNDERAFGSFPATVKTVRWGQRRYLIPESRQIDLVNAINRGMEPRSDRHGLFLLARDDRDRPVSQLPDLPDGMLALIRRTPLLIRVTSVDAGTEDRRLPDFAVCTFKMRMAVPDGAGLVPGLEFEATKAGIYETATIVEASGRAAVARMESYHACAKVETKPDVGWEFTSGAYKHRENPASR